MTHKFWRTVLIGVKDNIPNLAGLAVIYLVYLFNKNILESIFVWPVLLAALWVQGITAKKVWEGGIK